MDIRRETHLTDVLYEAFLRLLPQLSARAEIPSRAYLDEMLHSDSSVLLAAWEGDVVLGLLTLVLFRVPTGVRAHIEDVVVDASARGRGIGAALTREALRLAREAGADGVSLTSNPRREAANHLYRKLGFKRWETNLYFYEFESPIV
jgi:ribosomal protein S18 acetylase RimI-like enzyme